MGRGRMPEGGGRRAEGPRERVTEGQRDGGTEGVSRFTIGRLPARDALLTLIGPIGNPDQRGAKFRQVFKVHIHRDEPEPVLEGKSGDPEVGIG